MNRLPSSIHSLVVALCLLLASSLPADAHAGDAHAASLSAGSTMADVLGLIVIASAFVAIIWLIRGHLWTVQSRVGSGLARDGQMRDRISR